ncbi:(E)-4-hydroxy-3-methylbut-2-enyl-diphosphate synthase [Coraliomargarita akajimensis]|uniref:4-hydroxy-3-methylbut-2-en-1-yl diphosphate synthase (flavodoxin) n=1 Tax=Coraliomargarita akajimensis (strain DSM 45221 / IAM 15411 / JCM 23193 / KCTC 12865 / 04OKA010-24) TaxID=583355 RepID=D5EHX1_CORAD|nr:(E)-4-hydroxy-3-methylbut-2-enyl-diphosphate synthase [Coraliomargarita akajimensis]ADE56011.1 1-hydroxy-2-methyl-2-(E)-butenyl 4-diphosphate synthase [Coraliomargarita akajimensis DSM 45221]
MTDLQHTQLHYCASRFQAQRRLSREINVGGVRVGGNNPIRIQSMTTTDTQDVDATVAQTLALAEAGCEIVRITAPNKKAAEALGEISKKVRAAKCDVPLVADIHFLPAAAMEAAKHVEKVRINPGNYADKKKFAVKEYSDADYDEELERLHEAFSPIVLRCKELGRAMRIGTNHGSLSDRIMNRYGDSPLGMVESALEFIRIAESHRYQDICLSMKASNPKVMIEAYRLAVARMNQEGMNYPLHLGVTEAGDGEDARVKSAIGIGTLLNDGLGDTIRVSLTEDPIYEVPVARDLADKAMTLWKQESSPQGPIRDAIDPFDFRRRATSTINLSARCAIGAEQLPAVIVKTTHPLRETAAIVQEVCQTQTKQKDSKLEGLIIELNDASELDYFSGLHEALHSVVECIILELNERVDLSDLEAYKWPKGMAGITLLQALPKEDSLYALSLLEFCRQKGFNFALDCTPGDLRDELGPRLQGNAQNLILCCSATPERHHPVGQVRALVDAAREFLPNTPIWIRNTSETTLAPKDYFSDRLLETSVYSGALLCDGIGDAISIETEPLLEKATALAYNILQGARARISKTEFVACPSCGRTLFDLQSVTQRIRSRTDHLKGVTIAIMGCIVNGPGEMADADFGYVGGAPGKINLYVGKECVKYNVPSNEALDRLIDLIKEHGKWVEPS